MKRLSPRLAAVVDALPLRPGMRVLEIGCGPGAAARAIAHRVGDGHIVAIDRSAKAIQQAVASSAAEIASGRMSVRHVAIEDFELEPGEAPFDLAFAIRVGDLDGRHRELERQARERIARALVRGGKFFIFAGVGGASLGIRPDCTRGNKTVAELLVGLQRTSGAVIGASTTE